jgi:hypothetical protein
MFNVGLIDSLKMRIELSRIKVLDTRLLEKFKKLYEASETNFEDYLDDTLNNAEPIVYIINGITYRFYVKAYINQLSKKTTDYLVLQVSAKMLKHKYFEGITKTNYLSILNDLNAFKIVEISESAFLNALISDIDICLNQLIELKNLQHATAWIKSFPRASAKPLIHHIERTNRQGKIINLGIDFNKREKATNTKPYCKIYHKGIELTTKSKVFYDTYLFPFPKYSRASFIDNLVRYEFTIKASKHKKYLLDKGLLFEHTPLKTFDDLINIDSQILTNIAKCGLPFYLEAPKPYKDFTGLKPMELIIATYMDRLISLGEDYHDLCEVLKVYGDTPKEKVQKSQMKSQINRLFDVVVAKNPLQKQKITLNEDVNKFLRNIGLK